VKGRIENEKMKDRFERISLQLKEKLILTHIKRLNKRWY